MELSTAARRRGLAALLATNFLMFGGFFMVIPLVSIYFVDRLGLTAFVVGMALALRQLLQQGITVALAFGGSPGVAWLSFAALGLLSAFGLMLLSYYLLSQRATADLACVRREV